MSSIFLLCVVFFAIKKSRSRKASGILVKEISNLFTYFFLYKCNVINLYLLHNMMTPASLVRQDALLSYYRLLPTISTTPIRHISLQTGTHKTQNRFRWCIIKERISANKKEPARKQTLPYIILYSSSFGGTPLVIAIPLKSILNMDSLIPYRPRLGFMITTFSLSSFPQQTIQWLRFHQQIDGRSNI